tara:strand:+ start:9985 stop:10437 length:453 start_codon:yes stop_codon:yes gene_type:complete
MFLDRNEISRQLDIKDPFLMIDEIKIDKSAYKAQSLKFLKRDDWFFTSHMTKSPVMPATLQMEGMLQTLVLLIYNISEDKSSRSFIVDAKTRFHSKVFRQSHINYFAELKYNQRGIFKGIVSGKYNDDKICDGEFTYASPNLMNLPISNN